MCFSPRIETHLPDTSLLVVLLVLLRSTSTDFTDLMNPHAGLSLTNLAD